MPSPLRPPALVLAAALMVGPVAAPASADQPTTTSLWGSSGLVLMPTAQVLGFRDFSIGANGLLYNGVPKPMFHLSAGVFDGLEATVVYGVPLTGFTGLSGSAKYQLVRPTKDRPTGVAVGLNLLGVAGPERFVDGNELYVVLSQDFNTMLNNAPYTLFTAHLGFEGSWTGSSRMMGGVELPLGDYVSLVAEVLGPMGPQAATINASATYRPFREWGIHAYTMGNPGGAWNDRDYAVGVSYWGNLLGKTDGGGDRVVAPKPRPTPHKAPTARPTPAPTPVPTPIAMIEPSVVPDLPTPTPMVVDTPVPMGTPIATPSPSASLDADHASVRGSVLDDKGRPLAGWSVGVPSVDRWTSTDVKGRYTLELPLGPYDLAIRDPQGRVYPSKAIRLVTPQGMELPLVVSLPVGDIKGMVIDKTTKQGLGDATIQLFRAGETYSLTDRDNGAFHASDLPAGEYRMVVTRSRYQPFEASFSLAAKQEKSLVVALSPRTGSVAGRVTNLKGQGQPSVTVALPKLKLSTATDRLGAYQFQDVAPGEYEMLVTQGARRVGTSLVRVRSDETTTENVTISATAPQAANKAGTIAGLITDAGSKRALSGVKIVVEGGELTVLTITGTDGRYAVGDLPPGRYKVTASRAGYGSKPATAAVTTKAGATVNLSLSPSR